MKAYLNSKTELAVVGFNEAEGSGLVRWADEFRSGRGELVLKSQSHGYDRILMTTNKPAEPLEVTPAMVGAAQSHLCDAIASKSYFTDERVGQMLRSVMHAAHKERMAGQ